jgi:hypothetical protein
MGAFSSGVLPSRTIERRRAVRQRLIKILRGKEKAGRIADPAGNGTLIPTPTLAGDPD